MMTRLGTRRWRRSSLTMDLAQQRWAAARHMDRQQSPTAAPWWDSDGAAADSYSHEQAAVSDSTGATTWRWPSQGAGADQSSGESRSNGEPPAYVEWRRLLKFDPGINWPADRKTFLKIATRAGLYTDERDVTFEDDHVVLNMKRSSHGGILNYYCFDGKITIGQSNMARKATI